MKEPCSMINDAIVAIKKEIQILANGIIKHREETEHRIEESGKEARAMIKTVL